MADNQIPIVIATPFMDKSSGIVQDYYSDGNYHIAMAENIGGTTGPSAERLTIDWHVVLSEHDRWLRAIAFARLGSGEAVEEVMQEVALAAVRQAAPLQDRSKIAPWLYRLTVRQVLLYRRKIGRRRKLKEGYLQSCRPAEADCRTIDPLSWLLADERRQHIREALTRLSSRDAEILVLKYTENWSYHQLAEHLGISHSAVESRLHRARKRLRAELMSAEVVESRL